MWRQPLTNTRASNSFSSCSSFKDVQILLDDEDDRFDAGNHLLRRKNSLLRRIRLPAAVIRRWSAGARSQTAAENRIVVYYTSLRIVRKTFDDCSAVRSIMRGLRLQMDERDVSMDIGLLEELQVISGDRNPKLPRVFIGGRCVGGADEIGRLNESGELKRFTRGIPAAEAGACDSCGGHCFVLCLRCSGSHKVYVEKRRFRSCSSCNENGLVRCSYCFSSANIFTN